MGIRVKGFIISSLMGYRGSDVAVKFGHQLGLSILLIAVPHARPVCPTVHAPSQTDACIVNRMPMHSHQHVRLHLNRSHPAARNLGLVLAHHWRCVQHGGLKAGGRSSV